MRGPPQALTRLIKQCENYILNTKISKPRPFLLKTPDSLIKDLKKGQNEVKLPSTYLARSTEQKLQIRDRQED